MNSKIKGHANKLARLNVGLAGSLLLVACSGDGRPFMEAVEVNSLRLKTLTVVQPENLLPDLVINPGTLISFTLDATDVSDRSVSVSTGNRRWAVDNPAVASIDESGNLVALSNGVALVSVRIGSVASQSFEVEVRQEELQSIDSIVAVEGEVDGILERCLPVQYQAIGQFASTDGSSTSSLRALIVAEWSVENAEVGSVARPVDGFANVTGVNVDTLVVTVAVDGIAPASRELTVQDTLRAIEIEPRTAAVTLGNTLPLLALATYDVDGEERTGIDITESVNWSADEDNDILTVGNTISDKGIVTPLATGNEVVFAACGNLESQKTVIVSESDTTTDDSISIESVVLSLSTNQFGQQLRVSSGTSFDEDDEIASGTSWRVITNGSVASITSAGFITPLATGTTRVQAINDERIDEIDILVVQ